MRDDYPATDDLQEVTLEIAYPDVERHLNRSLPLVKWLLALPPCVVLIFLAVATVIVTVSAWFAVLLVGRAGRGLNHRADHLPIGSGFCHNHNPGSHRSPRSQPNLIDRFFLPCGRAQWYISEQDMRGGHRSDDAATER